MDYKVVVLDLDGTLLDHESQLSDYTREVLNSIQNKGVKIILASGRPYQSMLKFATELDLTTPLISNNGALVKKPNQKIIAQKFIAPEVANRLLEHAQEKKLHTSFYFPDCICVEEITEKADVHIKEEKVMPKAVGDLRKTLDKNLINVLFNIASERMNQVVADLKAEFSTEELTITPTTDNYIDVMGPNVNKGLAVANLLDQYQISPQEVISFGNNYNDVTMIELAGCGVAMANAPAEVKEAADKVAKDNDQAGVAIMLEKIFL